MRSHISVVNKRASGRGWPNHPLCAAAGLIEEDETDEWLGVVIVANLTTIRSRNSYIAKLRLKEMFEIVQNLAGGIA
jgi:hypothetical protein